MYLPLSLQVLCLTPFAYLWSSSSSCLQTPVHPVTAGRKRIAIVGGGTAGLAALKTFVHDIPKASGEQWDIVLFEQRPSIGGLWVADYNEVHPPRLPETPLYPKLHTNVPHPRMTYPGFPFPPMTPLFPSYHYVQQYYENYANHYNLHPFVRLNHSVSSARWVGDSVKGYWDITIQAGYPIEIIPASSSHSSQKAEGSKEQFDHLVVATGRYHYPNIPQWAKNNDWLEGGVGRQIIHSIYYRDPRYYADRNVLVVGGGSSGVDIASQVRNYAKQVSQFFQLNSSTYRFVLTYHSFGTRAPVHIPNVTYVSRTSHLSRTSVIFEDGSEVSDIDVIVLATGYQIRFPFLSSTDPYASNTTHRGTVLVTDSYAKSWRSDGRLVSNLNYVFPLSRMTMSLSSLHPLNALSFIGLPFPNAYEPSDIVQSLYIGHLIANRESIYPGSEDVVRRRLLDDLAATEKDMQEQGYDLYRLGVRLIGRNNSEVEYQNNMYSFLKSTGVIPEDGKSYVEGWRVRILDNIGLLKSRWMKIERRGEDREWLEGVRTEEDWARLIDRLLDYQIRP